LSSIPKPTARDFA